MLKIQPPTIEEATEDFKKLNIDSSQDWNEISMLKVNGSLIDKRGSVQLSVISDESRRHSLFEEEYQVENAKSADSSDQETDEDRKRKRQEEMFTDKARAAMVVIGAKDIKEALEHKKAVEVFRKTPEARSASILFQQARFLMKQHRFKEALNFINRALATDPENKEWLTEKCRCFFRMLQPETALSHVNEVLKKDPEYFHMTPSPASESFLTPSQSNSSISRRPSSALSPYSKEKSSALTDKEDVRHQTIRPVTSHISRRSHSRVISDGSTKISSERIDQKTLNVRPKTAAARKNRERAEAYTSEWFAFSPSASHIDSPLLLSKRSPDASTESLSYSLSSSAEDVPKVEALKQDLPRVHPSTARSKKAKERPKSCIAPSISRSLSQDKKFLQGILRDKGLKRAQTPYTKRVLRIARDAHKFVTDREKYWKNRERFIRYATPDSEDDLRKS
ncbi:uncharacterized protein LOC118205407 [Stegodyphus dumicola]|uniref:uncharacterized protein LOC118205407 n=1 Tax=Stegodyphus dumicola TaxID=202533 RepID=UPI0015B27A96|nr:uncharacterized protein LOC118205407 [Stegodyphus dumicola]